MRGVGGFNNRGRGFVRVLLVAGYALGFGELRLSRFRVAAFTLGATVRVRIDIGVRVVQAAQGVAGVQVFQTHK